MDWIGLEEEAVMAVMKTNGIAEHAEGGAPGISGQSLQEYSGWGRRDANGAVGYGAVE